MRIGTSPRLTVHQIHQTSEPFQPRKHRGIRGLSISKGRRHLWQLYFSYGPQARQVAVLVPADGLLHLCLKGGSMGRGG